MSRYIDADALKEDIANNVYMVADYFNSKDFGMFWTGGIEKIIDEQPTVTENRWIPVAERLPEKDGVYLCTFEGEDETDVYTLLFARGAFGHIDWEVGEFVEWGHEVTAWMPLTEPWEEENNV